MASKLNLTLMAILCFLGSTAFSQSYDWKDSSLIPKSGKAQHSEFLQNQYPFPAMPRNQWEVGIGLGNSSLSSDVSSRLPNLGIDLHVRKSLGYVFSLRGQYSYATARGLNWLSSLNFGSNPAWSTRYNGPRDVNLANGTKATYTSRSFNTNNPIPYTFANADAVYYNFRTVMHDLSLQGVITLNNVRFHKSNSGFLLYGFGGLGTFLYNTTVDALDANGNPYTAAFNAISAANRGGNEYSNRNTIRKDLKAVLDGTYETDAETNGKSGSLFNMTARPSVSIGAGVAYKLSKRLNLALEHKFTTVKDDLLDGQRWQEAPMGNAALTRDYDAWHYTSVQLNFNLGAKSVEPLWWMNPLDYAYNELNAPRHMKLPKPVLDDADGDGVADQFDREPNTPAGCPVDTHGVSRDTDGDGVPDCKDKELITPTSCQPVDADGVGKCPDPACCKEISGMTSTACQLVDLPSINFKGGSTNLGAESQALLNSVATSMRSQPNCKLVVCGSAAKSKSGQALGQKRVDAIVKYLVESQGISADRVSAQYDCSEGDPSVVELRAEQK
ncbi:MAG: OmpA family protein [Chitinophagaceae bacterium]